MSSTQYVNGKAVQRPVFKKVTPLSRQDQTYVGLVEEIKRNRRGLTAEAEGLLQAIERKLEDGLALGSAEVRKIESLYAFTCR